MNLCTPPCVARGCCLVSCSCRLLLLVRHPSRGSCLALSIMPVGSTLTVWSQIVMCSPWVWKCESEGLARKTSFKFTIAILWNAKNSLRNPKESACKKFKRFSSCVINVVNRNITSTQSIQVLPLSSSILNEIHAKDPSPARVAEVDELKTTDGYTNSLN